jgi:hypothetical protein
MRRRWVIVITASEMGRRSIKRHHHAVIVIARTDLPYVLDWAIAALILKTDTAVRPVAAIS